MVQLSRSGDAGVDSDPSRDATGGNGLAEQSSVPRDRAPVARTHAGPGSQRRRHHREAHPRRTSGSPPDHRKGASIRPLLDEVVGDYKTSLYVLLAATGCFLLIA